MCRYINETIRTIWNNEEEKYFISVVDIVGVISESKDRQSYWRKLKQRLKEEGNETVTNCHALKLKAQDGKYCMTDIEVVLADLGENVITSNNALNYEYVDKKEIENNQSPKSLLPWIGNFTQSFLHYHILHSRYIFLFFSSIYCFYTFCF